MDLNSQNPSASQTSALWNDILLETWMEAAEDLTVLLDLGNRLIIEPKLDVWCFFFPCLHDSLQAAYDFFFFYQILLLIIIIILTVSHLASLEVR